MLFVCSAPSLPEIEMYILCWKYLVVVFSMCSDINNFLPWSWHYLVSIILFFNQLKDKWHGYFLALEACNYCPYSTLILTSSHSLLLEFIREDMESLDPDFSLFGSKTLCARTDTVFFPLSEVKPSKCPKFYTDMTSGEKNLRQKVSEFCQNLNSKKLP